MKLWKKYWDDLAIDAGLKEVKFIYKYSCKGDIPKYNKRFFMRYLYCHGKFIANELKGK